MSHLNLDSTVYTHVLNRGVKGVKSPMDRLSDVQDQRGFYTDCIKPH